MTDEALTKVEVPDVAETFLAFRVWRPSIRTGALLSLSAPTGRRPSWISQALADPPGGWPWGEVLQARCQAHEDDEDHRPPEEDCSCGVYATTDLKVIGGYIRQAEVMGLVEGFGKVIPAERGLRAEKMKIVALFLLDPALTLSHHLLRELAEHYRVPSVRPHSTVPEDYRTGVRTGFAPGWDGETIGDEAERFLRGDDHG